jgi:hypothetical protein
MKENLYLNLKMTIEYGVLAFLMVMGAILIGALIIWWVINYNEKKISSHGGLQANGFLTPIIYNNIK